QLADRSEAVDQEDRYPRDEKRVHVAPAVHRKQSYYAAGCASASDRHASCCAIFASAFASRVLPGSMRCQVDAPDGCGSAITSNHPNMVLPAVHANGLPAGPSRTPGA